MTFIKFIKPNTTKSLPNHYLGSRGIIPKRPPPLHPRILLRNMMVLSMFLQKFKNSSALKLLLPSRNTILRPSTNLPRKEVYMSLTLLTMNYPHLRIPLLRNNVTFLNLMMHLTARLTLFWITSTASTTKRKT